jgi:NAD+ synthase (glutamine-hydrolysing)
MRIALAQLNPVVGDIEGNARRIAEWAGRARDEGAQVALFPELGLTGYPPEDLLLKPDFLQRTRTALEELADAIEGIVTLVGFPDRGPDVYNALALLSGGEVRAVHRKVHLPNYGVFDEQRYFAPADVGTLVEIDGVTVGLTICEDVWEPGPPLSDEALSGAAIVVNASASPYHAGKGGERERMLAQRAVDSRCAVAFCNLVGGQDELVFDGHSLAIDHEGHVVARAKQFEEELLVVSLDVEGPAALRLVDARQRSAQRLARADLSPVATVTSDAGPATGATVGGPVADLLDPLPEVYAALTVGLRDYVEKNGFSHVTFGLSGGIDSALVACLAADALGTDRVTAVIMPSPYSTSGTQDDARALADWLGIDKLDLSIAPVMEAFDTTLDAVFEGREADLTEENLQARIRGNLLMALSNKFGWLVLTTGNKSEVSVGYSTLYGDSAGGFAVIKDVPKSLVYALSRHRGVSDTILDRPPSAELRADQLDEDSLPPYDRLDPILESYVEDDLSPDQIVRLGFDRDEVEHIIRLVDLAEYKRRQQPPGTKISTRAFGRDRRMPITNRFRG